MNQRKKTVYFLLIIIMLAGICRYSYAFFVEKQGTHSDEEWSFGLANSTSGPYIFASDNAISSSSENSHVKNFNQWISGSVFKDYLTVQEDERFSFDSVYYNMACDMHPPLYLFILHFLSSFFVDQYVEALGLLINIFAYIITSIFIYKTLTLITKSRFLGLIGVLFNTFTVGALSMTIFLRMYAMSAMFATMLAYTNARLYYDEEYRHHFSAYIKLALITTLGALTHHYFLPYAFMLTAVMCICWLVRKEWKILSKYAGFMILSVALSIAIFPATLEHLFGIETVSFKDEGVYTSSTVQNSDDTSANDYLTFSTDNVEQYRWNVFKYYLKTCIELLFCDQFAFSPIPVYSRGYMMYVPVVLIFLMFFLLAESFLFRKEPWFIKQSHIVLQTLKATPKKIKQWCMHFNWLILSFFMAILFILVITTLRVNVTRMGTYTSRYLFIIYPLFNILFMIILNALCRIISKKKVALHYFFISVLTIAILLFSNIRNESPYLQKDDENIQLLPSISKDADIVLVTSTPWLLTVYCPLIYNANQIYCTTYSDFWSQKEAIEINQTGKDMYFVLDTSYLINEDKEENYFFGDININDDAFITYAQHNTGVSDTKELELNSYLSYIQSCSNVSELEYIGDISDFTYTLSVYKLH